MGETQSVKDARKWLEAVRVLWEDAHRYEAPRCPGQLRWQRIGVYRAFGKPTAYSIEGRFVCAECGTRTGNIVAERVRLRYRGKLVNGASALT